MGSDALVPVPVEWLTQHLPDGSIVTVDFAEPWMIAGHGLIWLRGGRHSPAAQAFIEQARLLASEN